MLSSSYNITEFIEKVKHRPFSEIIWMTDQEAFEAERCLYQRYCKDERDKVANYTGCLKDFILYLRHGVQTSAIRKLELDAFPSVPPKI